MPFTIEQAQTALNRLIDFHNAAIIRHGIAHPPAAYDEVCNVIIDEARGIALVGFMTWVHDPSAGPEERAYTTRYRTVNIENGFLLAGDHLCCYESTPERAVQYYDRVRNGTYRARHVWTPDGQMNNPEAIAIN